MNTSVLRLFLLACAYNLELCMNNAFRCMHVQSICMYIYEVDCAPVYFKSGLETFADLHVLSRPRLCIRTDLIT